MAIVSLATSESTASTRLAFGSFADLAGRANVSRRLGLAGGFCLFMLAAVGSLWWILAVDRGIDGGDEALYVLVASAPTPEYFWTNPWGWITRPLWSLSGSRLDLFRLAGAGLLVAGFISAAWAVLRAASLLASDRRDSIFLSRHLRPWISGLIGFPAALIYYSGFLRAPGYNWVNLMGLSLVVAAGVMWLVASLLPRRKLYEIVLPTLLAAGLVISGIGKPTTPIFEVAVLVLLGLLVRGRRTVTDLLIRTLLAALAIVALFWGLGWIGSNPFATIGVVLSQPQLGSDQTILGGLPVTATVPLHLALWIGQYWYYSVIVIATVTSALLHRRGRAPAGLTPAFAILVAAMSVLIWAGVLPAATREHNYMLRPEAVLATIGLVVAATAVSLNKQAPRGEAEHRNSSWWRQPQFAIVTFLCLQPSIYCFGTSNGPFQGMTWALGFLFLAAILVTSVSVTPRSTLVTGAIVTALMGSAGWCMIEGREYAYGMKPVAEQVIPVNLGNPRYSILVDADTSAAVTDFQRAAAEARLLQGQPVAVVTAQWSTLPALALGSTPPPSLMITLFGSPYSARIAEFNTLRPSLEFDWANAWITVLASQVRGQDVFPVSEVTDIVAERAGRVFPRDYLLASHVGDVEIWKPAR